MNNIWVGNYELIFPVEVDRLVEKINSSKIALTLLGIKSEVVGPTSVFSDTNPHNRVSGVHLLTIVIEGEIFVGFTYKMNDYGQRAVIGTMVGDIYATSIHVGDKLEGLMNAMDEFIGRL